MSSIDEVAQTQSARLVGQVKWFNNKAGYGFITVSDGEHSGKDIFVHFSTVRVTNSQYKYLIQGEYVEFTLVNSTSDAHEFQATDVSGIRGGLLMCETRRNNRPVQGEATPAPTRRTREFSRPVRQERPEEPASADGAGEFTQVRRRRPAAPSARKVAVKRASSKPADV
jgi:CspA family cold shock protein